MSSSLSPLGGFTPAPLCLTGAAAKRARVEATRAEAQQNLRKAVAALETIRPGLLYMQAGTGSFESLTMELEAAKSVSNDMENLLEGHREVERILAERRRTGVFTLVTDTPERHFLGADIKRKRMK